MVGALSPMDRKLLRDIWRLKSQVIAVSMVIASGVALLIMSLTSGEALHETTAAYYERYRFADVFATVRRAPEHLMDRIEAIPGVRQAESRIVDIVTVDIADFPEPVTARVVSLPSRGQPLLNQIVLRDGRLPHRERIDEVVLGERFAEAHGLEIGGSFLALLNGRQREVRVVGVALSPEFIYVLGPGSLLPDDKRFGIIWMNRDALAAAFDMEEAFNDVSLTLVRGVRPEPVIDALDAVLDEYGGTGALARERQLSNNFVQNEIEQQDNMAAVLPTIFLGVAAFLTNMIMARLVATEREQIGLFKAFGYSSAAIGWHYMKLVLVIAVLGIAVGFAAGSWLGRFNMQLFAETYQYPFILFRPSPQSYAVAALISIGTALVGSMTAVRLAVGLPPAEAMRPPAPPVYHRSWFSQTRLAAAMDEPTRMIVRRLSRGPVAAVLSAFGVALSLAVLLLALQWDDAINEMIEENFYRTQHQDATLTLFDAAHERVLHDVAALPGVMKVEGQRGVSARIRRANISRREAVIGLRQGAELFPMHDVSRGAVPVPEEGVAISSFMADVLKVRRGEMVTIEILEGRRPSLELPVTEIVDSYFGTPIYMDLDTLSRVLLESPQINTIHVRVDEAEKPVFLQALKETPRLSAINFRTASMVMFRDTIERNIMIFIGFFTIFSCTLSFGVIYNTLRISLAERGRELATLRVLGFRRGEISYILLGEAGILAVAAIPLGVVCGLLLSGYITSQFATELFRIPLLVKEATAAKAALVVLGTVTVCALMVRRRLDKLDLVEVLKTRE